MRVHRAIGGGLLDCKSERGEIMKHLILAVLLLCAAQGAMGQTSTTQVIQPDSIWNGHCGYGYCVHPIHIQRDPPLIRGPYIPQPPPDWGRILTEKSLVALWDEWQDSCWADSTVENLVPRIDYTTLQLPIYRIPECGGQLWGWTKGPGRYADTTHHPNDEGCLHAIHRDPNNLKEFINFIRRKPEKGRR